MSANDDKPKIVLLPPPHRMLDALRRVDSDPRLWPVYDRICAELANQRRGPLPIVLAFAQAAKPQPNNPRSTPPPRELYQKYLHNIPAYLAAIIDNVEYREEALRFYRQAMKKREET
jgi:hypothetical protein